MIPHGKNAGSGLPKGVFMAKRAYLPGKGESDKFNRFEDTHQIPRISAQFGKPKILIEDVVDKIMPAAKAEKRAA